MFLVWNLDTIMSLISRYDIKSNVILVLGGNVLYITMYTYYAVACKFNQVHMIVRLNLRYVFDFGFYQDVVVVIVLKV